MSELKGLIEVGPKVNTLPITYLSIDSGPARGTLEAHGFTVGVVKLEDGDTGASEPVAKLSSEERGATVADAKRLAEKAVRVFVHVRSDLEISGWRTTCIHLAPDIFLMSLRGAGDDEGMPSKLYQAVSSELWLQIG